MHKNEIALILFIKNARPGHVKSRLAATLGPEKALAIYEALVEHIRQVIQPIKITKYIYYSEVIEPQDAWDPNQFSKRLQQGPDLGTRMKNAFTEILACHKGAILIGSDIPGITSSILDSASVALTDHDLVIGGTEDGGYYLIGLREPAPGLFDGMTWSTETVFEETIRRAQELGLTWYELPPLVDIDYEEDWIKHGWDLE